MKTTLNVMKEIYFAGGCFWGTEHYFKLVNGVIETEVGYANGHTENPTYQDVCTDKTGFAETVRIAYDPEVISLKFLTEMYFKAIDPVSVNQQGHDKGTQYRTGIYYTDEADVPTLKAVYDRVQDWLEDELDNNTVISISIFIKEALDDDLFDNYKW